jgi:peptidoglycan/xylan/chitin deacetylase (PgdA/CDA1 family)
MKGILLACLVVFFFVGCDRSPVEEFVDEMLVSYDKAGAAADEASLQAIQRYIRSYRAVNGRYPESMEELESSLGTGYDLEPYDYDPGSGTLTLR